MPLTRPKAAQINFDVTNITDPLLRFNSDQTGTNDKDSGFIVERGDNTNVGIIWDESTDSFAVINTDEVGSTSGDVTISSYANIRANAFYGDGSNLTGISGVVTDPFTLTNTDTGSAAGPSINLYRNSASPAAADYLGEIDFQGESSTGVTRSYAQIKGKIADPTNSTEDGTLEFWIRNNGSNNVTARMNENGILLTDGMTLKYEGATNDSNETTLTVADPTADRTITLPDETGTVHTSGGPIDIYSASSDPATNLTAGQVYYNTTSNVLMFYNGSSWGKVSAATPIINSISGTIENGVSGTLTLSGTNFGTAQGTVHFTVSGTDTDVSVTPSSDTSLSVSIPSAIYGQSVGTTVAVSFTNSDDMRSAGTNMTVASSTFSSILTTSMPHSGINVREAGIRTETAAFTGATDNGITVTNSGFGWHDGHEGSPNDWPAYIAVYIGGSYSNGKAVNRLKISVHGNSFGNFELQGSNDANTSGTFYNTGNWTSLTYNSSGSSYSTQNAGGSGSGNSDGTVLTFNYTNPTPYTHYRIWFKDNSQPGSSGSLTGWAAYGWEMTRV